MLRSALYQIAGVDRETLAKCPVTDKMWAAHLGFSLLLSFVVVLGIAFHASGYVIDNVWMRLLASTVVALAVFMFDRSLYQSDWFYQGMLWTSHNSTGNRWWRSKFNSLRRVFRIAIRLTISICLAWVIAVFLELALFSDTIGEKLFRDHLAANKSHLERIEAYGAQLAAQIEERRENLTRLEALHRTALTAAASLSDSGVEFDDDRKQIGVLSDQIAALDVQTHALRTQLRDLRANAARYAEEMNAERLGQRINPKSSGQAGVGPRYYFAQRQKEIYETRANELQGELAQLEARREELTTRHGHLLSQLRARREKSLTAALDRRNAINQLVESARAELAELEASRLKKIDDFRRKTLSEFNFQRPKDDPLSRMTAYQELKNDPVDGRTIVLFSWMTKAFVIFLEVLPVVAKMFFSPPSVYAAKIQAQVERGRASALLWGETAFLEEKRGRDKTLEKHAWSVSDDDSSGNVQPERTAESATETLPEMAAQAPAPERQPPHPAVRPANDLIPTTATPEIPIAAECEARRVENTSTENELGTATGQEAPAEAAVRMFELSNSPVNDPKPDRAFRLLEALHLNAKPRRFPGLVPQEEEAPREVAALQGVGAVQEERPAPQTGAAQGPEQLRLGTIDPQLQYDMEDFVEVTAVTPLHPRRKHAEAEPGSETQGGARASRKSGLAPN